MRLARDPFNSDLQAHEQKHREAYVTVLTSILSLIKKQYKIEWINQGDDYTRYFFAKAKQRKMASYIYTINDAEGNQVEGFDQVGKLILPYYTSLLGKQLTVRSKVNMMVVNTGTTLSIEQQLILCKEFTDKEIKEAMFLIPNFKSPGPDGYSSGFYKST